MAAATRPPYQRMAVAVVKLCALLLIIVAINHGVEYLKTWLEFDIRPTNEHLVHRTIMLAACLYVLALAVPFVPGIEIGLALIALFGVKIVPLVYLCTVTALTLAYLLGRLLPHGVLARLAHDMGLSRVSEILDRFDRVPQACKLPFLLASAPGGAAHFLLRYRYVAVAVAINIPGNFIVGGGGGIALMAGISRLFSFPLFLLTVLIAVSPVPLLVLLIGPSVLPATP